MTKTVKKYRLDRIKPNKSSTFYLYGIWAIPKSIRLLYLDKLLKRKGAENNKNVILLKIVYSLVDNDEFHSWDLNMICRKCGFRTANQLYWYKAKILKDLRFLYFNWKECKLEIESLEENKGINETELMYKKASKMCEIGMTKEANSIFLKILKTKNLNTKTPEDVILAATIYYRLALFYHQKDYAKFILYYKALKNLTAISKSNNQNKKLKRVQIFCIMLNVCKFSFKKLKYVSKSNEIKQLEDALRFCRDSEETDLRLEILYRLSELLVLNFSRNKKRIFEAKLYLKEGLHLAKDFGFKDHEITFRSKLTSIERLQSTNNKQSDNAILQKYYQKLKCQSYVTIFQIRSLDTFVFSLPRNSPDYNKNLRTLIKMHILRYHTRIAFFHLYFNYQFPDELDLFDISKKSINGSDIVYLKNVNPRVLNKLSRSFEVYERELNLIHNSDYKIYSLINLILYEFLKGRFFDFENLSSLIKKYESYKKRSLFSNEEIVNHVEFLKISLLMFEESRKYLAKEVILNKYLHKFNLLSDTMISEKNHSIGITDKFLLITFVANHLNYPELWSIAIKQWDYLYLKYPHAVESLNLQYTSINKVNN